MQPNYQQYYQQNNQPTYPQPYAQDYQQNYPYGYPQGYQQNIPYNQIPYAPPQELAKQTMYFLFL